MTAMTVMTTMPMLRIAKRNDKEWELLVFCLWKCFPHSWGENDNSASTYDLESYIATIPPYYFTKLAFSQFPEKVSHKNFPQKVSCWCLKALRYQWLYPKQLWCVRGEVPQKTGFFGNTSQVSDNPLLNNWNIYKTFNIYFYAQFVKQVVCCISIL